MARSAIVIDDARLFKGFDDPACAGGITCYPSVKDLGQIICASSYGDMVYLYIMHDQIIVVGDKALSGDALQSVLFDGQTCDPARLAQQELTRASTPRINQR